jgi:hypothetical protein
MVYNVHVTRINQTPTSREIPAQADKTVQNRKAIVKPQKPAPSLVNVPADRLINKYPVRIFDMQPEE